jgi:lipid-A-disaccharide synthase
MAFMGFGPVLLHLRSIFRNLQRCRKDIRCFQPDAVILVDYLGFNLKIAKYVKTCLHIPVCYYISPQIWAWKKYRIRSFRRYVDRMFCILPFEKEFYAGLHYAVDYVGNPTVDAVAAFKGKTPKEAPVSGKPVLALLAGSRRQEIKDNLPTMLQVAAALVTSGTATLETCLFRVPQVVCYRTPLARLSGFLFRHFFHTPFISLINLIAGREVAKELFADRFSKENIQREGAELDFERRSLPPAHVGWIRCGYPHTGRARLPPYGCARVRAAYRGRLATCQVKALLKKLYIKEVYICRQKKHRVSTTSTLQLYHEQILRNKLKHWIP